MANINAPLSLPTELDQKFQAGALANESLLLSQKYAEALAGFQHLYELLLEAQPDNRRYHKGYPLHNIGYSLLKMGKASEALKYFILAYIEDLLSEEARGEKADELPAGKTLRLVYQVKESALERMKNIVHDESLQVIRDPEEVFKELARGQPAEQAVQPAQALPISGEKKRIGDFRLPWERRVFVGGNYKDEMYVLNEIKEFIEARRYEPVFADDFEIPEGKIHHHSLMLLHECSKAIFEISSEAGQLMEIERLRDYDIKPLIVYQSKGEPPRVTAMLKALLSSLDYQCEPFSTREHLQQLVDNYLP
jgi:hypothetical protein